MRSNAFVNICMIQATFVIVSTIYHFLSNNSNNKKVMLKKMELQLYKKIEKKKVQFSRKAYHYQHTLKTLDKKS